MTPAAKAKAWDLLAALPLLCWFALVAFACFRDVFIARDWASAAVERSVQLANGIFALTLVVLILTRPAAIARPPGWRSITAGIAGGLAPMTIVFLPRGASSPALALISNGVMLIGTLASVWIVVWLGRAFSILPQARRLVTGGPYALVRHPLYLAEFIVLFGLALQFALPWSLLLWVVALAAQFPRMHFEERILAETFPDYGAYAARTARLLPGIY